MNEQDHADFSALSVTAEPERWEALVEATLRRVDGVLALRPRDPLSLIASWSRSLTVAGGVAIALLLALEVALELRESDAERVQMLVRLSTRTALGDQSPTGEELARALTPRLLP